MITAKDGIFTITTKNTTYAMGVRDSKYVENLHYGRRITHSYERGQSGVMSAESICVDKVAAVALSEKFNNPYGNAIQATGIAGDKKSEAAARNLTLDNICLEFSNAGTGDYRSLPLEIEDESGLISTRFYYKDCVLYEGLYKDSLKTGMPYAGKDLEFAQYERKESPDIHTLELIFENNAEGLQGLKLKLVYTAFADCDVITRRTVIINDTNVTYTIRNISSMMLDLFGNDYVLKTFDGAWTRERHAHTKELVSGIYETGSFNGTSSSAHNPFIMLAKEDTVEKSGDCYAFNLIYSGNHRERVEVTEFGKVRTLTGINPYGFAYKVKKGEAFYSPEAVLTYSPHGYNGASHNMHKFVTDYIVPVKFKNRLRPILINNWEATYFDFNRRKLLSLADDAAKLGIELFVLDDGWFGTRNDDTTSLGDWTVNEKKLGGSLESLVNDIKAKGLKFGIWVEPEMISEKSRLYKAHPDWAVRVPGMESYLGRNQFILDYTRPDVRDYIVGILSNLFNSADISYVKWDMNRPITDAYSSGDTYPGAFYHDYVLGLYDVLLRLTKAFPDILFEGCSAGGNRFDLGILSYMPQIWTSDDTDASERMAIQEGTSYGYPTSTMGAHVSASPNHQTLRETGLDTRFNVASMGVLGYELDLTQLSHMERRIIGAQVKFYKEHRQLLQTGTFDRVMNRDGMVIWQITDDKKDHAIALLYRERSEPNKSGDVLKATGLDEDGIYKVTVRECKVPIKSFGNLINMVSPVHIKEDGVMQAIIGKAYAMDSEKEEYIVSGGLLMYAGIKLNMRFIGTGLGEGSRVMGDHSSRLYTIDRVK